MRKWGAVITLFYALVILLLVVPGAVFLAQVNLPEAYKVSIVWIPVGIVICGQALLLFLSVDTSFRRLKPRAHILLSLLVTGMLWALLAGAGIFCLEIGIHGRSFSGFSNRQSLIGLVVLWTTWSIIFFLCSRSPSGTISRATSWLMKGSVLELLIAVPAHVAARRRHDCSAPVFTSFGIATGISIMLLCFGPSVLLLYKKRMNDYSRRKAPTR